MTTVRFDRVPAGLDLGSLLGGWEVPYFSNPTARTAWCRCRSLFGFALEFTKLQKSGIQNQKGQQEEKCRDVDQSADLPSWKAYT
jgi:hypothetical protein